MGFVQTVVLGVVGSFVGGFLGYVLFDKDIAEGGFQPSGIVGSIIGAVIALLVYNFATPPRRRPSRLSPNTLLHGPVAISVTGPWRVRPRAWSERPHRA